MKKFFAFFAAALISVCTFASKEEVPSDAVLQGYYEAGQVCVCIFVPADMACNDIVFVGTYHQNEKNEWLTDVENLKKFEPVDNYDGWYVVAVDDESEDIQGKPVMLDGDGNFNWQYQVGAATHISGGVSVVEGAFAGEIDLKTYSKDVPNVYTVDAWKQNPCTAIYHNYKFVVVSDGCGGFVVPYLIGSMTGWSFVEMTLDQDLTIANGMVPTYVHYVKAAEGSQFQIVSGLLNENGEIAEEPAWADIAYIQKLVDGIWVRIPGEDGDNLLTKEESEIVIDLRAEDLRWARCDESVAEEVLVTLTAPAGAPEVGVEIIGTFDDWAGTPMTLGEDGKYTATISAKAGQYFKFRSAGSWATQIEHFVASEEPEAEGQWLEFGDGDLTVGKLWEGEEGARTITLDFSNAEEYRWKPIEDGIEELPAVGEKAQKVMIDGHVYILRGEKIYNVVGVQVR
jgi:hypothetical protein